MRFIQVDPPTTAALAAERHHRFIADVQDARRIAQLARRGMKGEQERTEPTHALWNDRGGHSATRETRL